MRHRIAKALGIAALVTMSSGGVARPVGAEEGGSGHYLPGGAASFIDTLPGRPVFGYLNEITYYYGSASRLLPLSGQIVARMDANVWADTSLLLWESPRKIADLEYAAAAAIPRTCVAVDATVQGGLRRSESASGLKDIQILPLMLVSTKADLKVQGSFGLYLQTGSNDRTRFANVGKNYWTFEPSAAFSYTASETGREPTVFVAFDFSTENGATNYKSGDVFRVDATLPQHLPLPGGLAGEAQWPPDLIVEQRLKGAWSE